MNLGKNIFNAFNVVEKTHENIKKFLEYCITLSRTNDEYELITPKFLRWKSDNYHTAWNLTNVILLFQNKKDLKLKNGYYKGAIYVLEVNLYEPGIYEEPKVNIAKYDYNNIEEWSSVKISPADHWRIAHPLYNRYQKIEYIENENSYEGEVIKSEIPFVDNNWWGLRKIKGLTLNLKDINNENVNEMIFENFKKLDD